MHSPLCRREFLAAGAAAIAAGFTGRNVGSLCAADIAIRENEHFWFRLAPEEPYIDSQRDNKAFGFGDGKIFLSEDNGQTWNHRAPFPDAENITFSCLLKNGNILFATRTQLFVSVDNLKSHRAITVKNPDGSDYLPHTPKNPDLPSNAARGSRPTSTTMANSPANVTTGTASPAASASRSRAV